MKSTDDLHQELMESADLDQFLTENQDNFQPQMLCDSLEHLFHRRQLSKASLARLSGMSEVYLYQVFAGRRNPTRSRLLCLCFGLAASEEETQMLLKHCGYAPLYPKNRRDAIILYGLNNHMDLFEVNDKLFQANEETLY